MTDPDIFNDSISVTQDALNAIDLDLSRVPEGENDTQWYRDRLKEWSRLYRKRAALYRRLDFALTVRYVCESKDSPQLDYAWNQ